MTNPSPEDFIKYIQKLSSPGSGLPRHVAVEAVRNQLRRYEQNEFFPEVLEELRLDNFHQTTKTLPQSQRDILAEAIQAYCES